MNSAANPPVSWTFWLTSGVVFILLLVGSVYALMILLRRRYQTQPPAEMLGVGARPRDDNPGAFVNASMQAVIQKLRDQEKELAQLHQLEKDRAQHTERLSEAVTRNMPAGLLLINESGLISSANPAAEAALGMQSLTFRKYSEVLGSDSFMAQMIRECLEGGSTFRREEVQYTTPTREFRQLGVTISPISNKQNEISGALCLLSDLTELAALQKQVQMKESLAALGELSAGIAHEFK